MGLLLSRLAFCFQRKECSVWREKKVCFSNWCFIFTRFEWLSDGYTPHPCHVLSSALFAFSISIFLSSHSLISIFHSFQFFFPLIFTCFELVSDPRPSQAKRQHFFAFFSFFLLQYFSIFFLKYFTCFELLWMGVRKIVATPPAVPPKPGVSTFSRSRVKINDAQLHVCLKSPHPKNAHLAAYFSSAHFLYFNAGQFPRSDLPFLSLEFWCLSKQWSWAGGGHYFLLFQMIFVFVVDKIKKKQGRKATACSWSF